MKMKKEDMGIQSSCKKKTKLMIETLTEKILRFAPSRETGLNHKPNQNNIKFVC